MPDSHATLVRAATDPSAPTPSRRAVLPCWHHALGAGMLLGLFVLTIRAALREEGAAGVWATIGFWVGMGGPAAPDFSDRAHGDLPPRSNTWT